MAQLAPTHPNIRLFFMGVKHPNSDVPEMEAVAFARVVSEQLGLTGKHVFFNETWVPYDDRQNYLLESDLGVSTHFQHVETTFSFRTRILDYLWAGLPIVTTDGDSFWSLVQRESLGQSVPERDQATLAAALERFLYDEDAIREARENVARVRSAFTWDKALAPLVAFCRNPQSAADKTAARGRKQHGSKKVPNGIPPAKSSRSTGIRRDFERAAYYFQQGGPSAVIERVRARRDRNNCTNE